MKALFFLIYKETLGILFIFVSMDEVFNVCEYLSSELLFSSAKTKRNNIISVTGDDNILADTGLIPHIGPWNASLPVQ